jgi:nitrogen fixation/metabolism regulation signal transduction histidine kinase
MRKVRYQDVTLRRKFILYLAFLHTVFAASIVVLLWDHRTWFIGVELFLLISVVMAYRLFRGLFRPLDLLLAGADSLREKDFTTRLRLSGQPEMDALIGVYNRMIESLHDERLALQEQHYFLEKIMAASPAGIITCDYDQKVSMVNPAAANFLGSPASVLIGKHLDAVASPLALSLNKLKSGDSTVVPLRGIRRVKCIRSKFIDRGFPRAFFLLEELTEELRQTEKAAYEKLIRIMSHEVNNSIGAANSLLHSSLHYKNQLREEDREDFTNALNIAISRTEHLNAFMKGFADIVRLPRPSKQPVDLKEMLEEICTLMKRACDERNIELRRRFEVPGAVTREFDRHQMEQVFVNILKNAMEAIGRDGIITISLQKNGARTIVGVEDTGVGIKPEVKDLIFTPFFSTKETGQGIGLTLVQEILTQHRFEFALDGEPGRPTRFSIYFP